MIEDNYNSIPLTDEAIKAFHKIRDIQVYGYCNKCRKQIKLTWNDELVLEGEFKVFRDRIEYSEVFERYLPWYNEMFCKECWNNGRK
jgi:hypothetical protein